MGIAIIFDFGIFIQARIGIRIGVLESSAETESTCPSSLGLAVY